MAAAADSACSWAKIIIIRLHAHACANLRHTDVVRAADVIPRAIKIKATDIIMIDIYTGNETIMWTDIKHACIIDRTCMHNR